MTSRSTTMWKAAIALPVVAYALTPGTSSLATLALVSVASLNLELILHNTTRRSLPQASAQLVILLLSLSLGSILSFSLSNPSTDSLFSSKLDTFLALVLYALTRTLFPTLGLFLGHALAPLTPSSSLTPLLLPTWLFALCGVLEESVGVGRVAWWISASVASDGGLGWVTKWGGQVAVDAAIATAGVALAGVLAVALMEAKEKGKARNLLEEDGEEEEERQHDAGSHEGDQKQHPRLPRTPLRLLVVVTFLAAIGPLLPEPAFHPSYPSPDPSYTYPPLKVACVLPPPYTARGHSRQPIKLPPDESNSLDEWIKETERVAGRGAKVLIWTEGAVSLSKGGKGKEEGWAGMGAEEQELLKRVAAVANDRKAYILATYLVPPSSSSASSKHKLLNVATLIGPASLASPSPSDQPYIVWSTTKHHPVPFVESYSHLSRDNVALGSASNALPLAAVYLPHEPHTPHPNTTPLQSINVAGAICQDVSFPSLLNSFVAPPSSAPPPRTPHLLLNPSITPISSFAEPQLAQARARAVENAAFLLHCDGAAGTSALIAPSGETLSLVYAEDGRGSWEAEVAIERGARTTIFARLPGDGRSWLGAEGAALLWLGVLLTLVSLVAAGAVQKGFRMVRWRKLGKKTVEGAEWVRWTVERLLGRLSEDGSGRVGSTRRDEEERLVEVD